MNTTTLCKFFSEVHRLLYIYIIGTFKNVLRKMQIPLCLSPSLVILVLCIYLFKAALILWTSSSEKHFINADYVYKYMPFSSRFKCCRYKNIGIYKKKNFSKTSLNTSI